MSMQAENTSIMLLNDKIHEKTRALDWARIDMLSELDEFNWVLTLAMFPSKDSNLTYAQNRNIA